MSETELLYRMAVALVVGLIVGVERGWHEREIPEGRRVAGVRTFTLIGFAGGLAGILGVELGAVVVAALIVAIAAIVLAARLVIASEKDIGATTEVAVVVTFALGAVAALGHFVPAVAGAVASAFLLGTKPILHGWLRGIDQRELFAALQLLLISTVVLPLLPNESFGPFGALNPYRMWWMVVLVAGVSFAGYVAVKLLGSRGGILLTGICGGLVSSTATTLALARRAQDVDVAGHRMLAAGIGAACTTMLARIVVLAAAIYPPLLAPLIVPFGVALLAGTAATAWLWRGAGSTKGNAPDLVPANPLELRAAITFGGILALVLVLAEAGRAYFGPTGLYILAAVSGLVDTDAITLSVAEQTQKQLPYDAAVAAIAIASVANTIVKGVLAGWLAPSLARYTTFVLAVTVAAGVAALLLVRLV